jgi:hypothetical protein
MLEDVNCDALVRLRTPLLNKLMAMIGVIRIITFLCVIYRVSYRLIVPIPYSSHSPILKWILRDMR